MAQIVGGYDDMSDTQLDQEGFLGADRAGAGLREERRRDA